jgi:hypothetical protein
MQSGAIVGIIVGHHQNDSRWAYLVPGSALQTILGSLPPRAGDATGGDSPSLPGTAPGPGLSADEVRAIVQEELAQRPAPAPGITADEVRSIVQRELTAWRPKFPGRLEQYDEEGKLIQAKDFTFGPDEPLLIRMRPYR